MRNKQSIVAIAIITAICLAGDSMLYIVLPTHWREIGLTSLVQVGILLSINRFVRLPLNPLIGYIYKKINFRNGIFLAVILGGLTTIGYGFVEDFRLWVLLRSIWGLSWSLFKLGGYLLILQVSKESNRGNYMGIYNSLYRVGSLFGMLIGGFFADLYGMRMISLIIGISAFSSIPILLKYMPKTIQTNDGVFAKREYFTSVKSFLTRKLIMILLTAFLLTMLLDGMLTATLSHIIEVKFSNHINILEFVVGAATVAGIIQAIRWAIAPFIVPKIGNLLDRAQQKNMILTISLFCSFVLLAIIPLNIPLIFWLPIILIHVLIASVLTMVMDTFAGDYASNVSNKIMMMTIFTMIVDLGAAIGPIASYSLEQKIGMVNLFWLASAVCLFLTIIWSVSRNERVKQNMVHPIQEKT